MFNQRIYSYLKGFSLGSMRKFIFHYRFLRFNILVVPIYFYVTYNNTMKKVRQFTKKQKCIKTGQLIKSVPKNTYYEIIISKSKSCYYIFFCYLHLFLDYSFFSKFVYFFFFKAEYIIKDRLIILSKCRRRARYFGLCIQ